VKVLAPSRGEIWRFDPDPTRGREQAKVRPALVVSADTFNHGPRGLAVVLPLTTTKTGYSFHVEVAPELSGLNQTSYIMCEQIRSVSLERFIGIEPLGRVEADVLNEVDDWLRTLLVLPLSPIIP
jgi:mRNA interferase MazF